MKYVICIFAMLLAFASCDSSRKMIDSSESVSENDTVRIANDSLEYEILIIEPGFYGWLATQRPRGYYEQDFLERKNQQFVSEWNRRVQNWQQYDGRLYELEINYQFNIDYGYEVNYLLYNYFLYFMQEYNQRFPGARG